MPLDQKESDFKIIGKNPLGGYIIERGGVRQTVPPSWIKAHQQKPKSNPYTNPINPFSGQPLKQKQKYVKFEPVKTTTLPKPKPEPDVKRTLLHRTAYPEETAPQNLLKTSFGPPISQPEIAPAPSLTTNLLRQEAISKYVKEHSIKPLEKAHKALKEKQGENPIIGAGKGLARSGLGMAEMPLSVSNLLSTAVENPREAGSELWEGIKSNIAFTPEFYQKTSTVGGKVEFGVNLLATSLLAKDLLSPKTVAEPNLELIKSKSVNLLKEDIGTSMGSLEGRLGKTDIRGEFIVPQMERELKMGRIEKWKGNYLDKIEIENKRPFGFTKVKEIWSARKWKALNKELKPEEIERLRLNSPKASEWLLQGYELKEGKWKLNPKESSGGITETIAEKPGSEGEIGFEKFGIKSPSNLKSYKGEYVSASLSTKISKSDVDLQLSDLIKQNLKKGSISFDKAKTFAISDKAKEGFTTGSGLKADYLLKKETGSLPEFRAFLYQDIKNALESGKSESLPKPLPIIKPVSETYFSKVGTLYPKVNTRVRTEALVKPPSTVEMREILTGLIKKKREKTTIPTTPKISLPEIKTKTKTKTKTKISEISALKPNFTAFELLGLIKSKTRRKTKQKEKMDLTEEIISKIIRRNRLRLKQRVIQRSLLKSRIVPPSFPTNIPVIRNFRFLPFFFPILPKLKRTRGRSRKKSLYSFYFERLHKIGDLGKFVLGFNLKKKLGKKALGW